MASADQIKLPGGKKISVFPILIVNFISTLGYSIIIPFLVYLVIKFGGNEIMYGWMGAVYPAFQLIGSPLLGRWSDMYGRKKILILSEAGTLAGWLIFLAAFAFSLTPLFSVSSGLLGSFAVTIPLILLFVSRAVDGITGGNVSVANAYLADISDDKDRKRNFGKISISANLGFIIGPALAGLLGGTDLKELLPVIAAVVISASAIPFMIFMLPETHPREKTPSNKKEEKITFKQAVKLPGIKRLYILYFLIFLGFNIFYTAFPVHAVEALKWSVTQLGIFFSILSLVMVVFQGPVLTWLSKKVSDNVLIGTGSVLLAVNFLLLLSGNVIILYLAAVMFAAGNGLMWPSFLSVLAKAGGKEYQGSVQGIAGSVGSFASIAGLIFGGIIYLKLNAYTFIIPAVIFLVLIFFVREKHIAPRRG